MSRVIEEERPENPVWLNEAVAELKKPVTPMVAGQLRAARRTALTEDSASNSSENSTFWQLHGLLKPLPALALGGCALAMGVYLWQAPVIEGVATEEYVADSGSQGTGSNADQATVLLEDLAIMAAQDELEFYQQLEFIEWLESKGSS